MMNDAVVKQLTDALEACLEYFDAHYDGAPDSHTRNMAPLMRQVEAALYKAMQS